MALIYRSLALISAIALFLLAPASMVLAAAQTNGHEIWCLYSQNRAKVTHTAGLLGLAKPVGTPRLFVKLADSNEHLTLEKWDEMAPADFGAACTTSYEEFVGGESRAETAGLEEAIAEAGKDPSPAETWGIPAGTTVAGFIVGYVLTRLARSDERRRQKAAALSEGLGDLLAALDSLIGKAQGGPPPDSDREAVDNAVSHLISQIPSEPSAEPAKQALQKLTNELAEGDEDDAAKNAERFVKAKLEVVAKVGAVISEIYKG